MTRRNYSQPIFRFSYFYTFTTDTRLLHSSTAPHPHSSQDHRGIVDDVITHDDGQKCTTSRSSRKCRLGDVINESGVKSCAIRARYRRMPTNSKCSFLILAHLTSIIATKAWAGNDSSCSCPTTRVRVSRNATRLLFIGAHHTGTNSYVDIFKHNGLPEKLRAGLLYPAHKQGWFSDPYQVRLRRQLPHTTRE